VQSNKLVHRRPQFAIARKRRSNSNSYPSIHGFESSYSNLVFHVVLGLIWYTRSPRYSIENPCLTSTWSCNMTSTELSIPAGMAIAILQTGGTIDKDYPRTTKGYAFEISEPAAAKILDRISLTVMSQLQKPLFRPGVGKAIRPGLHLFKRRSFTEAGVLID
jgi:hypothetical protein